MKRARPLNQSTSAGRVGDQLKAAKRWRDQYNPLRALTIARVVAMLEEGMRGEFADLQWTYYFTEQTHPVLRACLERMESTLDTFDWEIKTVAELPEGATEAQAEAQKKTLREAYDLIDNVKAAVQHLTTAEFRGFAHLQKIRNPDGDVTSFDPLHQWQIIRDGGFGDWYWNGSAQPATYHSVSEANRIGGEELPLADFIIREHRRPIDRIGLINFVRRNLSEKDWDAFVEIYGIPGGVVTMPPDVPPEKVAEYETAARQVSEGGSGAIPNGAAYTANTAARGDNPFKDRVRQLDEDMVLTATGGLLTMLTAATGIGKGPSEEHADAFHDLAEAIAHRVSESLQKQFDAELLKEKHNGEPTLAYFELCAREKEDVTETITQIASLSAAGYRVAQEQVSEKTGFDLEAPMDQQPGQTVDPVLERQKAYLQFREDYKRETAIQNREDEGGRWVTLNGTPVFLKEGESVKDAAARVFSEDKETGKSDSTSKRKTGKLKGQNERTARPSADQTDGGKYEQDKGRATTDVVGRSAGADPEDREGLSESFTAQKAGLEKLHAAGTANVKPNSSRIIGEGGEHLVELSEDGSRVVKHTKGEFGFALHGTDAPRGSYVELRQATPQEYIDRVHLHNRAFGDDTRVEGVSKAWSDDVGLVVSQRAIKGAEPSQKETFAYMQAQGFTRVSNEAIFNDHLSKKSSVWYHPGSGLVATDVKPDNFKKTASGQIVSVDTIVQHAKPGSALERAMKFGTAGSRVSNRELILNRADNDLASTLQSTLLPVLDRLNKIAAIDDAVIQKALLEKLLKDFPAISDALAADQTLAQKLSPQLEAALLDGLSGHASRITHHAS